MNNKLFTVVVFVVLAAILVGCDNNTCPEGSVYNDVQNACVAQSDGHVVRQFEAKEQKVEVKPTATPNFASERKDAVDTIKTAAKSLDHCGTSVLCLSCENNGGKWNDTLGQCTK